MADNQRWFKLWCVAPGDDALLSIPPELRWAWAALGCYTKEHGTRGKVKISIHNGVLAEQMGIPKSDLFSVIKKLPSISIEEANGEHGTITVTWQNWIKYQEDSTQTERQRRSRTKRRGEEKRKEEKGGEGKLAVPDWIPKQLWEDFKKARRRMKKSMTPHAEELAFKKLDQLRREGEDPVAVIEQSILNGYTGLFPVNEGYRSNNKSEALTQHTKRALTRGLEKDGPE